MPYIYAFGILHHVIKFCIKFCQNNDVTQRVNSNNNSNNNNIVLFIYENMAKSTLCQRLGISWVVGPAKGHLWFRSPVRLPWECVFSMPFTLESFPGCSLALSLPPFAQLNNTLQAVSSQVYREFHSDQSNLSFWVDFVPLSFSVI